MGIAMMPGHIMGVGLWTIEERRRAVIGLPTEEFLTLDRAKRSEHAHTLGAGRERREAALLEAQGIARSEMARRRRRLGSLTPEQESSIESLLISTVNKISEMVVDAMELTA